MAFGVGHVFIFQDVGGAVLIVKRCLHGWLSSARVERHRTMARWRKSTTMTVNLNARCAEGHLVRRRLKCAIMKLRCRPRRRRRLRRRLGDRESAKTNPLRAS